MSSLMGSIYVGTSGLQTSSNALNTSAHNLANVETAGYTRQQVLQGTRVYNTVGVAGISDMQVGLGVDYTKCRQVRDTFLDSSYRVENGRASFYEVCAETTDEIETLLGEMEGASFQESLSDLWTAVQELEKDPSSAVTEGMFVSQCAMFLERATAVATGLNEYQDNLNERVYEIANEVNDITDKIHKINQQITMAEVGNEEANDLRDDRNYLIDKLSSYVSVKTSENANGSVDVYCEGVPLILGSSVNHLSIEADESGFYNVTWGPLYDNMKVFNFKQEISSAAGTDVGELRAVLLARGDHRANYSDIDVDAETYNHGSSDLTANDIAIADSIVMNAQAEFDRLIHNIATALNDVVTDYAQNEAGTSSVEIFERIGTDRFDENGNYVAEDTTGSPVNISSMYTVMNLRMNPDLLKAPTLNSFMNADKTVDYDKALKIAEVFLGTTTIKDMDGNDKDPMAALNPNANTKLGFLSYYESFVGAIGNAGSVYNSIATGQRTTVDSLEQSRQQVLGVSSEEELQNIIKFQNAYNASSRYINVINEMLQHIIERL